MSDPRFTCCRKTRRCALREPVLKVGPDAATSGDDLVGRRLFPVDAVAEETLGIDRIDTELLAQLLAQLADVAFDDILFDVFIEDAVNRVEDLGLGNAAAAVGDQILENATLATGKCKNLTLDFRITTVREDTDRADVGVVCES